jgi:PAS domain S-box-containing protein
MPRRRLAYRSLMHPDDVERVVQEVEACLRANVDTFHQQYRLRHADGGYRYVDEHTISIRDAEGRPQYYLGYIHDISQQKDIEDDLRQTTANACSRLLESDTAYMVRTDMEGRFTFVNQSFKALIERAYRRQDELLGTDSMQTVVPEDHNLTLETVKACIEQPGQPYQVILRKPNPGGGYFYTLWEFVGVRGEDGAAVEIQCVGFDITPLMVVTQELTRREELYRFIFENTMDSISLYDGSGRLLLGNEAPAFEAVHTLAERLQMSADDQLAHVHPDDAERILREHQERTQAQQPSGVYTYRLRRRDGRYLWVENHVRYIYRDDGTLNKIISIRRDITERVQAQEALRHTNALLQSIIDSEAVYIVRTDLEARFTFVNDRFRKLIAQAYPALGEIIGTNSMETIVPEDHPKTLDTVARCIQAPGMPHQIVLRKAHPDGGFYHTLWEFTGVPDASGSTAEIQCVGLDITELTRAQEAMREQDQRYRFIVENSLDAVTLHAPDGRILAIGSGIDFFEDYTPDELMAMSAEQLADFIHPDDLPRVRAEQAAYLAAGIETASYTYRMLRRDGSAFWVENRVRYLRGADGQLTGIVAINRNIDALVQAQEALQQSEARYRTLTQMMSDFVFEAGFTSEDQVEIRWLEGNYEGVTGRPLETAVETLKKLEIHPDDVERRRVDMQRTREGLFTSTEYRIKHLDGHYVWLRISRLPIVDPQTQRVIGYYGAAQDISAEKNEEALREEQERLRANLRREEAFNQTIRRLVSAVSHDIRTPLTVIATSKDLLERYADRLSEERRRAAFETIDQQLQYISRMLEDLSKMIKGTLIEGSLQLSAVNLETLCRVTVDQLQQTIGQRHRLRFESDWQHGPVLVDETLISRILFNLLSNAIKFSPAGSVVTLRLTQRQRLIVLQVSDEGIGIPLEEHPKSSTCSTALRTRKTQKEPA